MSSNYKKDCYDNNPYVKVHYSHGLREMGATLEFVHYDKDLIIEFYRKGVASIRIEGNLYDINEGDIILLNPDELHVSERKDSCYMEKIVLHISEGLLGQFGADRLVFYEKIARKAKGKGNLIPSDVAKKLGITKKLNECLELARENTPESDVLLSCKTVELLAKISSLIENADDIIAEALSNKTVNKIIDYINRHYTENVTLDSLAERFHFSKYYISHLFKDVVRISVGDYLIARRLYVCNNLIRGGRSVKEAAFTVGFTNYSNFFRLYKKHFKITPQQFKEQIKTEA
ncbi:MAG: helix-turn-helix transcriptional regulator [Clostridia bacterium]|nr:helix-turn-helix transcriptional regulator [Clostridia bacterium]